MRYTVLHGIEQSVHIEGSIVKGNLVLEVTTVSNTDFFIPLTCSHIIFLLKRIKGNYVKIDRGQVHIYQSRIAVLVVVQVHRHIILTSPVFAETNGRTQLVLKVNVRIVQYGLIVPAATKVNVRRKRSTWSGLAVSAVRPVDHEGTELGKFIATG